MKFPTYGPDVARNIRHSADPARYTTMALAIRTIQREKIVGDFAEVGVYRGATSRFLVHCAPERTLYLFDTFAGFAIGDRESENSADSRFQDTSEAIVQRALGGAKNAIVRRGYFPETAAGLEDRQFAFVLLDLDVHAPTAAGLAFFYPRLTPGGYCFVHDFNSPESNSACRRALIEFLADKPERILEIPDRWGSAVFRKQ